MPNLYGRGSEQAYPVDEFWTLCWMAACESTHPGWRSLSADGGGRGGAGDQRLLVRRYSPYPG